MSILKAKTCAKCNKRKRTGQFHRSCNGIGGFSNYCKKCQHDHYVARKARLIREGKCIICALSAPEEGRTRCEGCRLRENANARRKYHETRSKNDPVG